MRSGHHYWAHRHYSGTIGLLWMTYVH
jgi:hypothetical protein